MGNVSDRTSDKPDPQDVHARVFAASRREAGRPAITQVEFGSAWYHEAAIRKAEKPQQHRR